MSDTITATPHEQYLAMLPPAGGPPWLDAMRQRGAALFRETDFPHVRMEAWRQTNIAEVNRTVWAPARPGATVPREDAIARCYAPGEWSEYVFVNGHFAPALSSPAPLPPHVHAGGLAAAMQGDAAAHIEKHLGKYLPAHDAYTALNSAAFADGALLLVPKNTALAAPVHFVFLSTGDEGTAAHIRNLIVLEENAEATVVISYASINAGRYFNNVVDEVALAPNAGLTLYKMVEEGKQGLHLGTTEAHHDRDSRLTTYTFTLDGGIVRNQLCTNLDGEGADCSLHGLYLNDGDRLLDNFIQVTHSKPHCTSRIAYKGVLDGASNAVFAGKVYVHPIAQKTDSNQLSQNLLLSDTATIDTKPQLEIFADDVKCTHGATVGAPPAEVIFYFRSRGIDEATARGMLTYGFADEVVSEIGLDPLRERLEHYVFDKYSPKF